MLKCIYGPVQKGLLSPFHTVRHSDFPSFLLPNCQWQRKRENHEALRTCQLTFKVSTSNAKNFLQYLGMIKKLTTAKNRPKNNMTLRYRNLPGK